MTDARYAADGRLLSWRGDALRYDNNGRLVQHGDVTFSWTPDDQLESVSGPALTAQYDYDAFGRRRRATVNGVARDFVYDGHNLLAVADPRRLTVLSGPALGDYHAWIDAAGPTALVVDRLGSVLGYIRDGQPMTGPVAFEPFGRAHGPAAVDILGFAALATDATGIYDVRSRCYSADLQRFMSPDPLTMAAPVHPYAYAANSPATRIDPMGLLDDSADDVKDAVRDLLNGIVDAMITAIDIGLGFGGAQMPFDLGSWLENDSGPIGPIVFGVGMASFGAVHHIASHYPKWWWMFEPLFEKAKLGYNDVANLVPLMEHAGPHPTQYHLWVLMELQAATKGLSGTAYRDALITRLKEIGQWLKQHPEMLRPDGSWWNYP